MRLGEAASGNGRFFFWVGGGGRRGGSYLPRKGFGFGASWMTKCRE